MGRTTAAAIAAALLWLASGTAQAAIILFEHGLNVDGDLTTDTAWPSAVDASAFDVTTGLGRLAVGVLALVGIDGQVVQVVTADIAFGWQSTIQFSSDAVYTFVKIFSLPWSWIEPLSIVNPTYAQIQGSRMVLKDGIYHLATPDLVSWWPFLLLSVA